MRVLLTAIVVALLAGTGCATVAPWERGILATADMNPEDGEYICHDDFYTHVFDVREAATGGTGHTGGGCGCN